MKGFKSSINAQGQFIIDRYWRASGAPPPWDELPLLFILQLWSAALDAVLRPGDELRKRDLVLL